MKLALIGLAVPYAFIFNTTLLDWRRRALIGLVGAAFLVWAAVPP